MEKKERNRKTMQDIQLINAGQLFPNPNPTVGGGGVVFGRRLRQTPLQNQALKCPRCDSSNTKFCYYNNYNLSQPRHFCKSCRRYWTKGGVLRNVPVGGGCRKSSKRSSAVAKSRKCLDELRSNPKSNNSNSSSESSSLTDTGNAAVLGVSSAEIAAPPSSSAATPPCTEAVWNSFGAVFGFGDGKFIFPQIRNPSFGSELMAAAECSGEDAGGNFTEIGNFSNLINETSTRDFSSASYDAASQYEQYDRPYEQWQEAAPAGVGYVDPTVQIDQHHHASNLGSEPLSWHQEQKMFGSTSAVDQGYWNQQQWSNTGNALFTMIN